MFRIRGAVNAILGNPDAGLVLPFSSGARLDLESSPFSSGVMSVPASAGAGRCGRAAAVAARIRRRRMRGRTPRVRRSGGRDAGVNRGCPRAYRLWRGDRKERCP